MQISTYGVRQHNLAQRDGHTQLCHTACSFSADSTENVLLSCLGINYNEVSGKLTLYTPLAKSLCGQDMMGFTLSKACASHFFNHPCGFRFTTLDISHPPIRYADLPGFTLQMNVRFQEILKLSWGVVFHKKGMSTVYGPLLLVPHLLAVQGKA